MAKKFSTSIKLPYKGAIANYGIQYCGGAKALPFYFPWRQYGTYLGSGRSTAINPGVTFSSFNPPTQALETVQGVFIDNTDCSSPVYLLCEDTGHMVACADNATAYFPLMTAGQNFTLFIETIDGPYQRDQQTNVFLLDKPVPPFLQGQASNRFVSLAQISGQEAFTVPVLSDRLFSTTLIHTGGSSTTVTKTFTILNAVQNTTRVVSQIVAFLPNMIGSSGSTYTYSIALKNGADIVAQAIVSSLQQIVLNIDLVRVTSLQLLLDGTVPLTLEFTVSNNQTQIGNTNFNLRLDLAYATLQRPTA